MLQKNRLTVYVLTILIVFGTVMNFVRTADYDRTREYPDVPFEKIVAKYKEVKLRVQKPITGFGDYFSITNDIAFIEVAARRYEKTHPPLDPRWPDITARLIVFEANDFTFKTQELLRSHQGSDAEFDEAKRNTDMTYSNMLVHPKPDPVQDARVVVAIILVCLGPMPFIFLIFCIRIRDSEGSIAYEIASNPMLPIYIMLWPVGFFKYQATGIQRQIRRMLHYASLALSAILSFGGATMKAETKKREEGGTGNSNSHTLVISGSSHGLSKYLGLNGGIFHPGQVSQSSLTIAHRGGLRASFFQSLSLTQSHLVPNYGREQDHTLGYDAKIRGRGVGFSVNYYNVTPQSRLPRGDLMEESVMITGLFPKFRVPHFLWIRNINPIRDGQPVGGQFVHFGVNRDFKISKKIRVAVGSEGIYDSGAFGFKRAGLSRSSTALKVGWRNLIFDLPILRMSFPFTKPGDGRKFEQVVGVGMSFSFAH